VVGRATKKALDAIARSSPFLRDDKKREFSNERAEIARRSNGLEFRNPAGRAKVYTEATLEDVRTEVARLQRAPRLWRHTTPYLVAIDDESKQRLPAGWRMCLEELHPAKFVKMSESLDVKGTEFQHVIMVLFERLFLQLERGFDGATQALYHQRRLYRIPMSRAKDSITVFVVAAND
jgi:superfamily I DNA/RNA helicase